MKTMESKFTAKREKVSEGIKKAFKEQFGFEPDESVEPFETVWPISCHDLILTEDRTFNVHLHVATGKVKSFTEEV